jgi:hypothetical protein
VCRNSGATLIHHLDNGARATRWPVWEALSTLFLDTDVSLLREYRASVLAASPYTVAEIEAILTEEVFPVGRWNLLSIAGEWAGFDLEWLESQMLAPRPRFARFGASRVLRSNEWRATRTAIEDRRLTSR